MAARQREVMGVRVMGLLVGGFQLQRALVLALRVGPLPLAIEQRVSQRDVSFRQVRIDAERSQGSLLREGKGLFRSQISVSLFGVRVCLPGVT